jgi:tetratricopeptide (TPR) repeat protein
MNRLILIALALFVSACAPSPPSEIESNQAQADFERGNHYYIKGQSDKAISHYNKAIELNPSIDMAYNNRGRAYVSKGQYDQAISDFSKAIEINPRISVAYSNRGLAYYHKGEHDKAWEDVQKAQSLGYQVDPEFLKDLREASGRQE